ncbi:MAG: PqqD family protein [Nitrospirae bacterium]|nr:PqqD family protein [Nitrospirota bacterium]MBI5694936.1 PqqD family protein [Nitrospirota bacterium]
MSEHIEIMPRANPSLLSRREGDSLVLFNEDSGDPFILNGTGARIFELADGRRGIGEIAVMLAAEYDAPEEVLADDCAEFISMLIQKGLLEVA